jgi:hypothetical protein
MTAQATESASVADRASRVIEWGVGKRMGLQKLRRMVSRPQFGVRAVARLATERQLDLAVANLAIGHLRQVGADYGVSGVNAAVAGEAGVRAV